MSQSADPGHFFQTDASEATRARRAAKANNTFGEPLKASSKILALLPALHKKNHVFIAESCGVIRLVDLENNNTKAALFRGFNTPCTCLALSPDGTTLFAGAWEKRILAWNISTREVIAEFKGHADFVKSLLYIPTPSGGLLLSGSSDANIIVWNPITGDRIATLKGHTRAIGTMALDPNATDDVAAVVFAGGSEREIRKWQIPYNNPAAAEEVDVLLECETSVHALRFLGEDGDLWAASADGTARRIDVAEGKKPGERTDTMLTHRDYVNDVVLCNNGLWVATGCRDEEVRLWDVSNGNLVHTFEGHADEVTALAVVGSWLVSVGIDCTVRRWSVKPEDVKVAIEEARKRKEGVVEEKEEVKEEGLLTAEEEAELAELMDDSD
ncbi:WD40-repeat-containing domain protein [Pyronema omphalodes]|nr:WD40-repeat-containing domain protein [Pyronema omphalodes]